MRLVRPVKVRAPLHLAGLQRAFKTSPKTYMVAGPDGDLVDFGLPGQRALDYFVHEDYRNDRSCVLG